MITKILFLQSATDVKDLLSIESVSAIGVMVLFIAYLMWQNHLLKKDNQTKDTKITQIIQEHQKDLKDGNKDAIDLINKYHSFVEQLSSIYRGPREKSQGIR